MITFIHKTLVADAQVKALIGNKVFPQVATQGTVLPYVTYAKVSRTPERCRGDMTETMRVQVNCFGTNYPQLDKIEAAVMAALDMKANAEIYCEYTNVTDLETPDGQVLGRAIDFQLTTK